MVELFVVIIDNKYGCCHYLQQKRRGENAINHKHIGDQEISTSFAHIEQLFADFLADVEALRNERE